MTQPLLCLLDGHYFFHRAYHAGKPRDGETGRRLPDGTPTWAAYGFTRMLLSAIAERKPAAMAVAFDVTGPGRAGRRREKFPAYKANRPPLAAELTIQLPIIKEIVSALGLPAFEVEGYEADDVIGTIARRAIGSHQVEILTGDRDMFQLVNDVAGVRVVMPRAKREEGEPALEAYDEAAVFARMKVRPDQIVDYKGLAGDASDNIPGIPSVGDGIAVTLLEQFGTFDALFADDRELYRKGLRGKLTAHRAIAEASRELATIDCATPVDFDFESLRFRRPDMAGLVAMLEKLEFLDLAAEFAGAPA